MRWLEEGHTLVFSNPRLLARKNGDTIAISAPGYTLRLRTEDFASLYGHLECAVLNEKEGIDEQKDEEYYAWRRIKQ